MSEADIIYSHINSKDIQAIRPSSKEITIRYIKKIKSISLRVAICRANKLLNK